ncbi:MAG: branched-chain amino acid ABC transporter permease [Deltaproteobacteria bacterium]|nr:MAG: branched-chain amino acid ABC transporter permease [Deltaproteobacteria bacterium]
MKALVVWLIPLVALALVPIWLTSPYPLHIFILLFIAVAMGESWNVLGGFAGQYSVGHAAYYGLGAYGAFILLEQKHVAPWFGVWVAVAIATAVALIIGSITFRLRGPYFVLASIAVAEIIRLAALNWKDLTNGAEGILASDLPILQFGNHVVTDWNSKTPYYYMGLAMAVFCVGVNFAVKRSKLGYYLQAIREDQDAAHSLGIPLTVYKNAGLVISAACTALAGSFAAFYVGFIEPQAVFGIDISVQVVLICIIGGIGTVTGPMIGAVVLVLLSEALRANLIAQGLFHVGLSETSPTGMFLKENLAHAHVLIYGILVIVVILFMPDGFVGFFGTRLRRKPR